MCPLFGGRALRHCRCKPSTKRPKSAKQTTGLIHHSDHGLEYVSVVYNQRLAQHGITASTGTVGDSYDNALAENVNGSYKNELIHTRRWNDVVEVEIATFEWVSW
ncbi:DDE-type integrase/transposase/recombinase [Corynebacterium macginleyi]|uniref:integrase core domain-containing protein n=1 Tax=Corynebacterium macginleyi TaxID=38290 RepID=UPI00190A809F|nr:DDE-type integrase/transposase/recombinase [Corynebacterium macginleyi]